MELTPPSLLGLDREALKSVFSRYNLKPYHLRQFLVWVYQRGVLDPALMTDLTKEVRAEFSSKFLWHPLKEKTREISHDGTVKFLFECTDGETIETVWIPQEGRSTVCVSSQVGCRMGCRFCHTATMGLKRSLSSAEIVSQLLLVKKEFPVTNVVFMGMGEPFDNYDQVMMAIRVMIDDLAFRISRRRVTVSTSGLVPQMVRYAREMPSQLAVSLNSSTNELRYQLMPVNKRYPIEDIVQAVDFAYGEDRRRVTFEYILMKDLNDSAEDAKRLGKLLKGLPCKVNLIPYNSNLGLPYERPLDRDITRFQSILLSLGYNTTVRISRGPDISAACGQLKSREEKVHEKTQNRSDRGQWSLSASRA